MQFPRRVLREKVTALSTEAQFAELLKDLSLSDIFTAKEAATDPHIQACLRVLLPWEPVEVVGGKYIELAVSRDTPACALLFPYSRDTLNRARITRGSLQGSYLFAIEFLYSLPTYAPVIPRLKAHYLSTLECLTQAAQQHAEKLR